MEAKDADLSALRITRPAEPTAAVRGGRGTGRLKLGLVAAAVLVVGAGTGAVLSRGAFQSAVPVRLAPATVVSPTQSAAVLVASGDVVAQRKAAGASKGTTYPPATSTNPKSTSLNSSHVRPSESVFFFKKKKKMSRIKTTNNT